MNLDAREFRNALGRFATGVCVITTVTERGEALGLTANSFASVSLDPPLVLWSLQNSSEVFDIYTGARHYAINVLEHGQIELSGRYARRGDHLLAPEHFSPGQFGVPIVRGSLVSFECEQHAVFEGGDHVIILGRVGQVHGGNEGEPLLFYGGAYWAVR